MHIVITLIFLIYVKLLTILIQNKKEHSLRQDFSTTCVLFI